MSVADLEYRLADPAPGFRCFKAGDQTETIGFLAHVTNRLHPPANAQALARIDKLLPATSSMRILYQKHNGALLFEDTLDSLWTHERHKAAALRLYSVEEWDERSREMRESLIAMGWTTEEMPDWLKQGIAFCEIPCSGNYFVIMPSGVDAGKVFYADHDRFEPNAIADSFDRFLNGVAFDPAAWMSWCGWYTRYSDGKTETQWIPKDYVSDARK